MNFYNDNDPKACAWLRELIADGHLPPGDVDERSILEIKADELRGFDQCHFFAGVGFWSLALQWAGLGTTPGIWTGSCPCQPFSCAGAGKGTADERHLWPVFRDLIVACRPSVVFGEQVASAAVIGKVGRGAAKPAGPVWLDGVRADVEAAGYAFGAAVVGAHSVGAPHIRQRCYWVADRGAPNAELRRCERITEQRCNGILATVDETRKPFVATGSPTAGARRTPDAIQRGIGGGNLRGLGAGGQQVQEPQDGAHLADEPCHGHADAVRPSDAELSNRGTEQQPGEPERRRGGLGGSGESCWAPDTEHTGHDRQGRSAAEQDSDEQNQRIPDGDRDSSGTPDVQRTGGAPHAGGQGLEEQRRGRHESEGQSDASGVSNPWSDYRVHRYLDGKDRRIPAEPRLFPLADDRHPYHRGRVGLLRGAGNAIVPALAAEFIEAWKSL
jgi:DNA (cytosine-5)-methyltransferase 1